MKSISGARVCWKREDPMTVVQVDMKVDDWYLGIEEWRAQAIGGMGVCKASVRYRRRRER